MPCISGEYKPQQGILLMVGLKRPVSLAKPGDPLVPISQATALVDTGAARTCVAEAAAKRLNLPLVGKGQMLSASDVVAANIYMADFFLPFGKPGQSHEASIADIPLMAFQEPTGRVQVLLGLDILSAGFLNVAGSDRRFTFCL